METPEDWEKSASALSERNEHSFQRRAGYLSESPSAQERGQRLSWETADLTTTADHAHLAGDIIIISKFCSAG